MGAHNDNDNDKGLISSTPLRMKTFNSDLASSSLLHYWKGADMTVAGCSRAISADHMSHKSVTGIMPTFPLLPSVKGK